MTTLPRYLVFLILGLFLAIRSTEAVAQTWSPLDANAVANCRSELESLTPLPAVEYVAKALEEHAIVFLGESHGVRQLHEFYRELITTDEVLECLDDVFVEFLSSFHQPLLDRYLIDLHPMDFEDLAPSWRDVPGIFLEQGDDIAAYELIQAVREINEELAKDERVRLLAGDSDIDWRALETRREWATALNRRDRRFLEILWDEVLDHGRRAIAILGRGHLKRIDPSPPNWINLVPLVEARAEGRTEIIHLIPTSVRPKHWPVPSILPVQGTGLADLTLEKERPDLRFEDQVDAVLFVGSKLETVPSQPFPAHFQEELKRRRELIQ